MVRKFGVGGGAAGGCEEFGELQCANVCPSTQVATFYPEESIGPSKYFFDVRVSSSWKADGVAAPPPSSPPKKT